jgi:hypothetical protein
MKLSRDDCGKSLLNYLNMKIAVRSFKGELLVQW